MGQPLACRLVVRRIADIQQGRMGTPLVGGPTQVSEVADRNQAPMRHPGTNAVAGKASREVVVGCECAAVR